MLDSSAAWEGDHSVLSPLFSIHRQIASSGQSLLFLVSLKREGVTALYYCQIWIWNSWRSLWSFKHKNNGIFYEPLLEAYLVGRFGINRPTALLLGYELLNVLLSETGCEKDRRKVRLFVSSTTYSFNRKWSFIFSWCVFSFSNSPESSGWCLKTLYVNSCLSWVTNTARTITDNPCAVRVISQCWGFPSFLLQQVKTLDVGVLESLWSNKLPAINAFLTLAQTITYSGVSFIKLC